MKKHYYLYFIAILALIISLPAVSRAEDGVDDSDDDSAISASSQTEVESEVEDQDEAEDESDDDSRRSGLPRLRDAIRAKSDGIEINEATRNKLLGKIASSTRIEEKDLRREDRREDRESRIEDRILIKSASSSEARREARRELRKDQFEAHKNILVRQLNLAIANLKQIRDRIAARITKAETSGRDMSQAKSLLITADTKISLAEQSIGIIASFSPASTTSATTTATTTIDLTKPRQLGETAIKAVKEAHKALVNVVTAIAHAMGLKSGQATTTPPVVATTTATTTDDVDDNDDDDDNATTTATTTAQ